MIRTSLLCISFVVIGLYACNKIETKKFHDNACENVGAVADTVTIEQSKFYMSAKINSETEIQLRLHGTGTIDPDSIQSLWVQIKSSSECYQAKSFKTRKDNNDLHFVIDYVVPTFVQVNYPATWKFLYKGKEYYLKTTLSKL